MTLTPAGVVEFEYKPDAKVTIEETQLQFARLRELFEDDGGPSKRPFQVDLRRVRSVPREVRQLCAHGEASKSVSCVALIVSSKMTRFIAHSFVNFASPPFPVQVFNSEEVAKVWASRFLSKAAISQGARERRQPWRTDAFEVTVDDSGLFVVTWNEGVRITRDLARLAVVSQVDLEGATTAPVLVDMRAAAAIDADAKEYLQSLSVAETERPLAVVTRWRGVRLTGQLAAMLKQTRGLRFFTSLNEARRWLGEWQGVEGSPSEGRGAVPVKLFNVASSVLAFRRRPRQFISAATETLVAFSKRNFGARVPESRQPDLDALGKGINDLGDELKRAFDKLERQNRELEEEVEARTRDLRETHAQLVQSSKLAAMGELSAGIAHEINNPLAVVHARARQLGRLAGNGRLTDDRAQELAESISRNAERITEIVRGFRNFARDSQRDAFETASVGSILQETLELCERRLRQTGVSFSIEGATDLEVDCRKTEIAQVFLNLLNNAVDAVRGSDEARIAVSVHDRGETAKIHFSDSGGGVPPEIQQKILEPFFTTKPSGEGTGIGLSISQGIVRSHGGELSLDPEAQDTTFVVSLPKAQGRSSEAKPTASA